MIPLYIADTESGAHGQPRKNPIYFITKSIGKPNSNEYDIININATSQESEVNREPSVESNMANWENTEVDVEIVTAQPVYDMQVEPYPDRSGSLAGEPRKVHTLLSFQGFIRGDVLNDMQGYGKMLNRIFDPTLNYLQGASTFDDTQQVIWQTPYNVGYGVLAWFDPSSKNDWRVENDWVDNVTDPFEVEEFARLNRFMFVRSTAKPVRMQTKFGDYTAPFLIQFTAVDPTIYEFIAPEEWWGAGQTQQLFIDESANGKSITGDNGSSPTKTSNEEFIVPDYPWRMGPGWREVDTTLFSVAHLGRNDPGTDEEHAMAWVDFNLVRIATGSQTLTMKVRWADISGGTNDISQITFDHPHGDISYVVIKPVSNWMELWWGNENSAEANVSNIDFTQWTWIKIENNDDYIRVKVWPHGSSEPGSWLATASRGASSTDMTDHHFWRFDNDWANSLGAWDWQFDVVYLTPYTDPADSFTREVADNPDGWGSPENDGTGTAEWNRFSDSVGFAYVGEL